MRKKIIGIFVCIMLVLSTIVVIVPNNLKVEATSGEGGDEGCAQIDVQYIYNITKLLSCIINNTDIYPPGTLAKGRDFGSDGEHYAAIDIISYEMDIMGLYNPELDPPYLEKMQSIDTDYMEGFLRRDSVISKLDVIEKNITIHNLSNNTTQNIECHIRPEWNLTALSVITNWPWPILSLFYNIDNTSKLTQNHSYNNLTLRHLDNGSWLDQVIENCNETILDNLTNWTSVSLFEYLINQTEDYWNFNLDELNETNAINLGWYNETYGRGPFIDDFLYIGEDQTYNPNATKPQWGPCFENFFIQHPNITNLTDLFLTFITNHAMTSIEDLVSTLYKQREVLKTIILRIIHPHCKGIIYYDFNQNTYDINSQEYSALPILYINGTTGKPMDTDPNEYRVDYTLKQQWNNSVDSYNVIGQINGTDNNNTTIICSLYDSWWNQGTADAAIGMATVLAIAKYFQEQNIIPKNNIKFIAFGGEEHGYRGAYYYQAAHPNENITMIIDVNQIGFTQNTPRTSLDIWVNNETTNTTVKTIADQTDYVERTGNTTDFATELKVDGGPSNTAAFAQKTKTIMFVKDSGWILHHRDGENHTQGDAMSYYNETDINLTSEIIYNITKYYLINPDCWFTNYTVNIFDSPNDGDMLNDSIRANFTLNTILPHDKLRVELLYDIQGGSNDNLYSIQNYSVNSSGLDTSVVFSVPDDVNKGDYSIKLALYNSTGIINKTVFNDNDYTNDTSGESNVITLYHPFGYTTVGDNFEPIDDRIIGSNFTVNENCYADNITAYINRAYMSPGPYQCLIYRANDSKFIANTTEEWIPLNDNDPSSMGWAVFNFSEPKPLLTKDTEYVITCWGEDEYSRLYFDYYSLTRGMYDNETYGEPPDPANFSDESRLYSIYCSYTPLGPEINSVSANPDNVGFGFNVTISANVTDDFFGVNYVKVNIIYPDMSSENYTMNAITNISAYNYHYIFNDTWQHGMYNYTIWAYGNSGGRNSSSEYSFNVSANATISVCTLKDNYTVNEFVNITDPPNPLDDYYIVERGLTWDKYYNADTGVNTLVVYQGPINYQNETNDWTPINCSLDILEEDHIAYDYGYRFGNEQGLYNVIFKPNIQDVWSVVFAYNKSSNPEDFVVRSQLLGVGYLDPTNNWDYKILQNTRSSQGQIVDNSITYENVLNGTDLIWSYGNTGLKEEIIMSNTTKGLLQNHPPSDYGLSNQNSYLVFITGLDYSGLNMYNSSGVLDGNFTISDGRIDFKDALGNFKCALPLGEAYEQYNYSVSKSLTHRVLQYNNNYYLLSGLSLVDLNNMCFPVVIDPTLTIESQNTDGYIYNSSSDYNTVWNATTGTVSSSDTYITVGQKKMSSNYYVYRGFLIFNTTELPDNACVYNATVSLYKKDDVSTKDFFLTLQNGQPDYPHNPLEIGDYNKNYYSGCGGGFNTSSFVDGRNNITLTNNSWLTREGFTKFCLRSSLDIDGTAPPKDEFINFYSSNSLGVNFYPRLIISYGNQSKIKNDGIRPIKGYLLMQVHFFNDTHMPPGWVVVNDTVNETTARTINAMDQFGLDTVFNDIVNTSSLLSLYGRGLYRVYAVFRDSDGNVLICDDDSLLETSYEFTIDI